MNSASKVQWTEAQLQAIETNGCDLLVSAGAGSGKTAVLVERVIRKILAAENPLDLEQLLVVTFTNAAAGEMRQKIGAAISQACRENPHNEHLLRQLSLLPQSHITTVHSFCLDLVRRYFYLLGIDASCRVAGQLEQVLLLRETLEHFIEDRYQSSADLPALVDAYGGVRDDADFLDLVIDLYEFMRSQPEPQQWLTQAVNYFIESERIDDYPWSETLLSHLRARIEQAMRSLAAAVEEATVAGFQGYALFISSEYQDLQALLEATGDWRGFLQALRSIEFSSLPRASKVTDPDSKKGVQKLRDQGKKIITALQQELCACSYDELVADMRGWGQHLQALSELLSDFDAAYTAEKRRKGIMDFGDMEHLCLQLLEDHTNGIAECLREQFTEVMVDEYQDINAVQERILQLVARGDNSFVVGDIKQSIYRFRLAEPQLFLSKYEQYGQGINGRLVALNKNFRSQPVILSGVNYLFSRLMSEPVGGLNYDQEVFLISGKESSSTLVPPQFYLLDLTPVETDQDAAVECAVDDDTASAWQQEASFIGQQIMALHQQGYAYKDMVILLRSLKNRQLELAAILHGLGIPVVADSGESYLETAEVELMISLLQVIDNPLQDIPLAAVLRSQMVGLSLDQLLTMRLDHPGSLYQAMTAAALTDTETAGILQRFLARLTEWRTAARRMPISQLLWQIYHQTGFYELVGALPQGEQRQRNLHSFYERAKEYESGSFKGLLQFLRFIEQARQRSAEAPGNQAFSENEDVVRILSIHKSKGLEYPVVFVAGLGRNFFLREKNSDLLWHKDLGLGPKIIDRQRAVKYPTLAHEAIKLRLFEEAIAEELRILYVALTRAKERLILTATVKNLPQAAEKWSTSATCQGFIPTEYLYNDKRPSDWICRALLNHRAGQPLREAARLEGRRYVELSAKDNWRLEVVRPTVTEGEKPVLPEQWQALAQGQPVTASAAAEEVQRILSYQYPQVERCNQAAKLTVTQLQKLAYDEDSLRAESELLFAQEYLGQQEALARGTAYHFVMQHLPLDKVKNEADVNNYLQHLLQSEVIPEHWLSLLSAPVITAFLHSELGQRMRMARSLKRELPFVYALHEAQVADEPIILQGVIDAVFEEEDGWVIVDYKTGGRQASKEELQRRYGQQLTYYRQAFAEIMAVPVKQCWLYMLEDGRTICL